MSAFDILFLSVALAMDCFAVSLVCGVVARRFTVCVTFRMAVLFGAFQAFMPFVGWLGTSHFSKHLESVDHWIAFGLLTFIGLKMVKDSFSAEGDGHHVNPKSIMSQIVLAVATSIDALAVGISFACLGYNDVGQLAMPLFAIGVVSFLMSLLGNSLGIKCGPSLSKRLKPELFGGALLVLIGVKILISHLAA